MNVKSNIKKILFYTLTQRRNFIPILSIYFLTLNNTTATQIGIFTAIGYIASFLLEIPSGYISDNIGHKKTLIIAKIAMLLSTFFYIIANEFYIYTLGTIFQSISLALVSGTKESFMHETLTDLNREKDYSKIMGKIGANASIFSAILALLLPFLTKIDLILPIKIYLIVDIIGLIIATTLITPLSTEKITKENKIKIKTIIKKSYNIGLLPIAIFTGAIIGFATSLPPFRTPYLEELGLPLIYMGVSMALSRVIWFLVGNKIKLIEKIKLKNLMKFEIIFFPIMFILMSIFNNPYVVLTISAISVGYMWGRSSIFTGHILENHIFDKKYKASILSIKSQIEKIFNIIIAVVIGIIMNYSYKLGHLSAGIILFSILIPTYFFIKKK